MTQAYNLSQLANNLNTSGQLDATDGLVNAVPVANGGTGAATASAARTNLGLAIGTDVPSPTGTGASGSWGISITGNAATATNSTNATNATTATRSTNLAGGSAGTVPYQTASGTTAMLSVGTTGQVLQSNGAAAPSWTTSGPTTITPYWLNLTSINPGRDTGNVYQNTSGKTRFVLFAFLNFSGYVWVDAVDGNTTQVAFMQAGGGAPWNTTFFIVPNGYFYKIGSASTSNIYTWTEWQ